MPETPPVSIFEHSAEFDPAADFEGFLRLIPPRWVVYLLADADDRPVQLLCVRNLRYSLKRRLGAGENVGPSRRVNYRELVRRVRWRRVDSAFEADWAYYEAARVLFPGTYQGMVGFRPAWFVHVDPDAVFPRYVKTIDLTTRPGVLIGPVEDKHAAARLIHLAEDAFDLCRYYNVLTEAPRGKACAYKEMGKCPAPCDGSVSMEQYRRLMEWSAQTIVDPSEFIGDQKRRMEKAAVDLRFETAGKIKGFVSSLSALGKGPFRHVRRLGDFNYLSLQHGPRDGTAKVFVIAPGRIEQIACLIAELAHPAGLLKLALSHALGGVSSPALWDEGKALAGTCPPQPLIDAAGAERVGIVAHHLLSPKQAHGIFLPLATIDEKAVGKALRDLRKQPPAEDVEGEGVTKELQAMDLPGVT